MNFLSELDTLLQTFWYLALPVSLIFIIQTIMTFIGVDASDGLNADFDGDVSGGDAPFQLFSLRNLIHFLLGFSWGGISLYSTISSKALLIFVSFVIGAAFVGMFFLVLKQVQKLAEDNTFSIDKTVGKTGSVYLRVPADKQGTGIIQISVNGTVHELKALSNSDEILTGSMIRVIQKLDENLVLVEKL